VTDDGCGIAAEFLPLLFERFRQAGHPRARARGGGLGLGLAIARYLVETHRGTITRRERW
jgi:signal transduction histidine kinase